MTEASAEMRAGAFSLFTALQVPESDGVAARGDQSAAQRLLRGTPDLRQAFSLVELVGAARKRLKSRRPKCLPNTIFSFPIRGACGERGRP
jgi:hypothetical protein